MQEREGGVTRHLAWDDLKLVKAVAEARGMTGAAATLGVDQSTVFRRLGTIETRLATPLFERHRTGYALTAVGEEMVRVAERIEEEIAGFERRLTGDEITPAGDIRVATADSLLIHLLTPVFGAFQADCPEIRLDVVIGNMALNLSKRDADIAIRATDTPPDNLVGRRIGTLNWALYGRASDLPDAANLDGQRWVGLGEEMAGLKVVRDMRARIEPARIVYRTNTVLGLAEAIEAGIGIGHLPCFIGDVRSGLVRLSGVIADYAAALWLLTHPDLRHSPRIRIFMDFISAELVRLRPLIEGERPGIAFSTPLA